MQNNKISFKGITKELGQIKINSAFDLIEQWQKLRWAPYYEALDDKVYPQNKEIRKANLDLVMDEIELLIKWVASHVEGDDKEYLLSRLKNMKEVISNSLENDEDVLYIF